MSQTMESTDTLLRRALVELREMRSRLKAFEQAQSEPIAIVGMGCRFPGGADSPERFWELLTNSVDAIDEIPAERWDIDAYYDPDAGTPGKANTRWGAFLKDIDRFDPVFFGLSVREAAAMDPQQRLLLEVAWEALEDAGIKPERAAGSQTGVFVGLCNNDFVRLLRDAPARGATGIANSIAANRLSYVLNLKGPSLVIDSACSSSLVAVDLACESLRSRSSNLALAGGVNVILSPELTISFSQAGMMAPDGRCKTFDTRGNGYVRGEGCGLVILKRLSDALAEGDSIIALIRGSAINQDGRSNGLTAPSMLAQQALIRTVLERARVQPRQITLIEAHGTGTPLGDPIEVEALKATYGERRAEGQWCALGSVKTNMGHLESAAGIAGLIKAVLCLQHGSIPPHLHFRKLNPNITLEGTGFVIPTQPLPWPRGNEPRFAAVSSFGLGGTNAHVILEEGPAPLAPAEVARPTQVLALSAKSPRALSALAERYAQHLEAHPEQSLVDVCHTANVGREVFAHRLAAVSSSSAALKEKLERFARGEQAEGVHVGAAPSEGRPRLAFLFTGQGAQHAGMGRALYETQPTFRRTLDQCAEILRPGLGVSLLSILYPEPGASSPINDTGYAQPALFALQVALAALWRSWGVEPDAVMGHSVGELTAACVAGVFSLEDGLRLSTERARLMQALPRNGMMALVVEEEAEVAKAIADHRDLVSIAAVNGPKQIVISGETNAVTAILERFEERFVYTEPLRVSHAFHSPLMAPMLDAFERFAHGVRRAAPRIPWFTNLTGEPLAQAPSGAYFREHVHSPVLFQRGIEAMHAQGFRCFLELGPHDVLCQQGKKCLPKDAATWLPSLNRKEDGWQVLCGSAARLHADGFDLDWSGFDRDYAHRRVALPTYPFERRRCWLDPSELKSYPDRAGSAR
jgi:acyl transferase domain-containing protein